LQKFDGNLGIGAISDTDSQPILVNSKLGRFAISTVAKVANIQELENEILAKNKNFTEFNSGKTNQTELIAQLITEGESFEKGIRYAQSKIKGSCTLLILTPTSIIAARDYFGRTPLSIGKGVDSFAVASEDCSFANLGFESEYVLGPGEVVEITSNGYRQLLAPEKRCQICSFLWIYYGNPTSNYEGINADHVRHNLGVLMGKEDKTDIDVVSPIPDSGTCMAIGYAQGKGVPYRNAMIKYSATWPRSFTPADQSMRSLVAKMKLLPNYSVIKSQKVCFCDDSIVRGTQLKDNIETFYRHGVKQIHIRISCPPLIFPCPFVNYTSSKSPLELITRRYIQSQEGEYCSDEVLKEYATTGTERYNKMVDHIRTELKMDTLQFNTIENLVKAIGLPKESICTHCFDGSSFGY